MIIYEATKQEFMNAVTNDTITEDINREYEKKLGKSPMGQVRSWHNSMEYMFKVLCDIKAPADTGIAIEFNIPMTSKRIDFILSGYDENEEKSVVIIELKQWESCTKVDGKDGVVKTFLNGGQRETTHPSYQADTYRTSLQSFSEPVEVEPIELHACAYLHNYKLDQYPDLMDSQYENYIQRAPLFVAGDVIKLRNFIDQYIKKGDQGKALYEISEGKIRPSKILQDSLVSMLQGNQEFVMIDEQKLVYEEALSLARECKKDGQKRTLIIKGGPGTGKSVVAINLLVQFIDMGMLAQYVTKNSAPRNVYFSMLKGKKLDNSPKLLFKGSGCYVNAGNNDIDVILADEAHRLNEKSGMFHNTGENQVKEIIRASRLSVFFIDEHQRVTTYDNGSVDEIKKFAQLEHSEICEMKLESQFRCNGSDGYLAWIDQVLEIEETANTELDFDYDFQVFDDPNKMRDAIIQRNKQNRARILAGYCWNWDTPGKTNRDWHDIKIPQYQFEMSWNMGNTDTWAIDKDSINEAGCIHTSQGLEFEYVGVIIGDDLRYEDGKVITDYTKRARSDNSLKGIKKMMKEEPERAQALADSIIRNTYRTLLTRGNKGCYVFCTDPALAEYLKKKTRKTTR